MAYSSPTTRSTGYAVTSAVWNQDVVANVKAIAEERPTAHAYRAAALSIPNAADTVLTLPLERFDVGGVHSTVTNTSRMTCPTGGNGIYVVGGYGSFAANTGGGRRCRIVLNGVSVISSVWVTANQAGSALTDISTTTLVELQATDYIELMLYQTSGGALNATGALWIHKELDY